MSTESYQTSDGDDLQPELEVMNSVAHALGELPDVAARLRVLHWAVDREEHHLPGATATRSQATPDDSGLSVDDLDDLFPGASASTASPESGNLEIQAPSH